MLLWHVPGARCVFGKVFFRFPLRCFHDTIVIQAGLFMRLIRSVPDLLASLIKGVIRCAGKMELNPVSQDEHAVSFNLYS